MVVQQVRRGFSSAARSPLAWVSGAWLLVNLLWLRTNRWTRYGELDEAGYARLAINFERQPTWSDQWRVLTTEGSHGPLQALLTYVPMKLTVGDLRVLIMLNLVLTVVTALAAADLTATIAGRRAGTVAGVFVLLMPGVVQFSHNALTATLPMAFMAVALAALARSRGLQHLGWSVTAGLAAGCMVTGRSMAVGFLPALAVAGLGWAWARRSPLLLVLRNGLCLAASTAVVAGWWFVARWSDVGEYLLEGGSSDTARVTGPLGKTLVHALELGALMGGAFVLGLVVVLFVLVRRSLRSRVRGTPTRHSEYDLLDDDEVAAGFSSKVSTAPEPTAVRTVAWPLVASVAAGLLTLGVNTAFGVGFVLSLIPATVAACVATADRVLGEKAPWAWSAWAGAVLSSSLLLLMVMPDRGMDASLIWCNPDQSDERPYCSIHDNATGARWQRVNDHVADRITIARTVNGETPYSSDLAVAMTVRDHGLSGNMVSLSLEVRHRSDLDLYQFFVAGLTIEEQLDDVVARAGLVVAVEDFEDEVYLSTHSPSSDQVLAAVREADFLACDGFETPDGRRVTVLRAPDLPSAACVPLTAFGL